MAEYDCEGCGMHVFNAGIDVVASHQFCLTCLFIEEHLGALHPDRDRLMKAMRVPMLMRDGTVRER